jgi:hypothetical protein
MDDIDKKVKGNVMIGYRKFVKKKWGLDGLDKAFKDKRVDLSDIQDKKWYHYRISVDLLDWIGDNYGIDYCRQAGYSVIVDAGVITWAARVMGIKRVLDRGVEEFRNSLNYGEILIKQKENEAKITLKDVITGETDKMAWLGVFQGILKITKKDGDVKVSGGGDNTTYKLKWK